MVINDVGMFKKHLRRDCMLKKGGGGLLAYLLTAAN